MVGFVLPAAGPAQAAALVHTPNAWVHIGDDNTITLISARAEMGQGVYISMREMLVAVAAQKWNVDPSTLKAENGWVLGPKGQKASYGQLAEAASKLPAPAARLLPAAGRACTGAAVGADGKPTALTWRVASQSVTARAFGLPPEAPDGLMVEAAVPGYEIPAARHDAVKKDVGVRVGYWRSVSHCFCAAATMPR